MNNFHQTPNIKVDMTRVLSVLSQKTLFFFLLETAISYLLLIYLYENL